MRFQKINEANYEHIYVISDIHGSIELFDKMMEKIQLKHEDLLVILGDSCDRGLNTKKVYDKIIKMKSKYQIIHLQGNHECMMLDVLRYKLSDERWKKNGMESTLASYMNGEVTKEHIDYIEFMPNGVESENYYMVHAGINPEVATLEEQTLRDLTWIREPFLSEPLIAEKKVIFGHSINQSGCIEYLNEQKIAIDCGSYINGRLGCYEIKSKKEYYVDVEVN